MVLRMFLTSIDFKLNFWHNSPTQVIDTKQYKDFGPLAQLARALPWHGRGRGFKSLKVHQQELANSGFFVSIYTWLTSIFYTLM